MGDGYLPNPQSPKRSVILSEARPNGKRERESKDPDEDASKNAV